MNKKLILLGLVAIAAVGILAVMNGGKGGGGSNEAQAVVGDPLDTITPFYDKWLDAAKSTTTDPFSAGLQNDEHLSSAVKEYIAAAGADALVDPVLCQTEVPPRIGGKVVYKLEDKAQYMMLTRGTGEPNPRRALVEVTAISGAWQITKIECVNGEMPPEREFSFEREGSLLKNDAPPLDPNTWYLVFEEDGRPGHIAPLFFSAESQCIISPEETLVCNPDSFINPSKAIVKGEMTEAGVEVKFVEFTEI